MQSQEKRICVNEFKSGICLWYVNCVIKLNICLVFRENIPKDHVSEPQPSTSHDMDTITTVQISTPVTESDKDYITENRKTKKSQYPSTFCNQTSLHNPPEKIK